MTAGGPLHAIEVPFLHPGEKRPPLVAAQGDGRVAWISQASKNDSVASCRDLDARTAVTPGSMQHQLAARISSNLTLN